MKTVIEKVRAELGECADEETRISGERFFKETIKLYGVKAETTREIARKYFAEIKDLSKNVIFDLCEELWQSKYFEESLVACDWSYRLRKKYIPHDFDRFEHWIKEYISNWASCDTFCNHTVSTLLEMYPQYTAELKKWARSDNRWMRRAAAVSLIVPARNGKYLKDVFAIADILLLDEDDMVQKGYGWMLKVSYEPHRDEVFDYVMAHKDEMPRTALRYAIEKMPKDLKEQAMAKE